MEKLLLKNGTVMDGTGTPGYQGDVLLEGDKIACVSSKPLPESGCRVIRCDGKAISPGFIDAHSHNDQVVYLPDELSYTEPFIRQGITTFVGGNCGFTPAGMGPDYPPNLLLPNSLGIGPWPTYVEYMDYLRTIGLRQNMALLAGHGTAAASVIGYHPTHDSSQEDQAKISRLLEEGLDAGCKGISFGLGYRPGQFLSDEEIRKAADPAIRRDKVIAVHSRALNVFLPALYGEDRSEPHNIRWHREFFEHFRDSGAKLQISHLLFAGIKAWQTYDRMFDIFDTYAGIGGIDLWFDMYAYPQGATTISVMLGHTPYFYQNIPELYESFSMLRTLEEHMRSSLEERGFPVELMMLCDAQCSRFREYQGCFFPDILAKTGMTLAEFCAALYRDSDGCATIYFLFEQEEARIPQQMAHPRALYMTDAWYQPSSHQNACAYGTFPKFLRLARKSGRMTLEQAVAHMTGMSAERFGLCGRGYLRNGFWADLVVFDPSTVAEGATVEYPERTPVGIDHVFINGVHLLDNGRLNTEQKPGQIL